MQPGYPHINIRRDWRPDGIEETVGQMMMSLAGNLRVSMRSSFDEREVRVALAVFCSQDVVASSGEVV